MIKVIRKEMCMGCGACVFTCPRQCIVMQEDEEGFLYPEVNQENCMQCGLCEKICPIENKRNYVSNPVVEAYAGKNKTEKIRMQSSSGGIFTLLAEEIIAEGGTVYGAAFGEDAMVSHRKAEKPEELKGLRGSKYLQSNMGKIYPEIREKLSQGERVLFTGTPCQVAGLQSYLKKSYENLYCMDIICHGVPSPKVWKKYLEALEKRLGENLSGESNPSFRAKYEGWIRYSVSIPFSHDTEYRETLDQNLYMQTFLKNISLRPSCYQCQFKPSTRISDITLADFWGIQEVCPELFDDKGTSLIIVNSSKGQNLFTKVREKMEAVKVDYEQAILHNASAIKSVEVPPERKSFFKNLNQGNIEKRMRRVIHGGIIRRMSMRKIILWIRRKIRTIYNDRQKKRLKNKNITIISSNCNGGCISNELGLRFNSPFVNLWLYPGDFLCYLKNIDYYNSLELEFIKEDGINYPIGKLDQIKLYFQHYKSEEEAKTKWEERKKRIDMSNCFILFSDRDGCTYDQLKEFDSLDFPFKIVLCNRDYPELKSARYIRGFENQEFVGICSMYKKGISIKKYYDDINYVSWFNSALDKSDK